MPGNQISHVIAHPAFEGDDGHSREPPCCVWFSAHDPLFQRKKFQASPVESWNLPVV